MLHSIDLELDHVFTSHFGSCTKPVHQGRIFGVRKPRLRLRSPKPCFGLQTGEARLRPLKAGAWLPHSKWQWHKFWTRANRLLTVDTRRTGQRVAQPSWLRTQ